MHVCLTNIYLSSSVADMVKLQIMKVKNLGYEVVCQITVTKVKCSLAWPDRYFRAGRLSLAV